MKGDALMNLFDICMEIAMVENGLAEGSIQFDYPKLAMAMGAGHPADILDDIFCEVGEAVYLGKDVTKEQLENLLSGIKSFSNDFKIKELKLPISHLKEYIESL